jgi:xanthine dehydrogenase accessory factor
MEAPGAEAEGPLTRADFWEGDWKAALKAAAQKSPPEGGRVIALGPRRYYLSGLEHPRSALVLGGGHVGRALGRLLRFLEFEVTLADDRAEFLTGLSEAGITGVLTPFDDLNRAFPAPAFGAVVIVTRGHAQDTASLRQVLRWASPDYVGMIGSRKRAAETLVMLAGEGFGDRLEKVHTPVGLPIGAQTPQEIAVSIAAEIIKAGRRGPAPSDLSHPAGRTPCPNA